MARHRIMTGWRRWMSLALTSYALLVAGQEGRTPTVTVLQINAGGGGFQDDAFGMWQTDRYFQSGGVYTDVSAVEELIKQGLPLGDYAPPTMPDAEWDFRLFASQRFQQNSESLRYTLPLPQPDGDGVAYTYQLDIFFAEIYAPANQPGARVFDVLINNQVVVGAVDVVARGGYARPVIVSVTRQITAASLNLELRRRSGSVYKPFVSAFRLRRSSIATKLQATTTVPPPPTSASSSTAPALNNEANVAITAAPFDDMYVYKDEMRINCGGDNAYDQSGRLWLADLFFNTGRNFAVGGDFELGAIYGTERWDRPSLPDLAYVIPAEAGASYVVRLHFAEIDPGVTGAGQRVFNVLVEGLAVAPSLDVFFAAGGAGLPLVLSSTTQATTDSLTITLTPVRGNPKINAIELLRREPRPCQLSPCLNGGTCIDFLVDDSIGEENGSGDEAEEGQIDFDFECICPAETSGSRCEGSSTTTQSATTTARSSTTTNTTTRPSTSPSTTTPSTAPTTTTSFATINTTTRPSTTPSTTTMPSTTTTSSTTTMPSTTTASTTFIPTTTGSTASTTSAPPRTTAMGLALFNPGFELPAIPEDAAVRIQELNPQGWQLASGMRVAIYRPLPSASIFSNIEERQAVIIRSQGAIFQTAPLILEPQQTVTLTVALGARPNTPARDVTLQIRSSGSLVVLASRAVPGRTLPVGNFADFTVTATLGDADRVLGQAPMTTLPEATTMSTTSISSSSSTSTTSSLATTTTDVPGRFIRGYAVLFSSTAGDTSGNSRRFSTAFTSSFYAFEPIVSNRAACAAACDKDELCQGLFVWLTGRNELSCVGLLSVGSIDGVSYFGQSVSYFKTPYNEESTTSPLTTTEFVYPCDSNPCKNGAVCENLLGGFNPIRGSGEEDDEDPLDFICLCPFGFEGAQCEISIAKTTVMNPTTQVEDSSTTTTTTTTITTTTTTATTSATVSTSATMSTSTTSSTTLASPCMANPCLNGATCTSSGPGPFDCACPPLQFYGRRCEEPLRECTAAQFEAAAPTLTSNRQCTPLPCSLPLACRHGGACTNKPAANSSFVAECACPRDVTGTRCEILPPDRLPGAVDTFTGVTLTWEATAMALLQLEVGPVLTGGTAGDILLLTSDHLVIIAGGPALTDTATKRLQDSATFVALPVKSNMWRLATLDFDGDGIDDVALFNYASPTVRLLWLGAGVPGNDSEAWPAAHEIALPEIPENGATNIRATSSGDVDGDGREDILEVAGAQVCTTWMSGEKLTTSCAVDNGLAQAASTVVAAGDMNGDGRADLVVASIMASGAVELVLFTWDDEALALGRATSRALPLSCTGSSFEIQYAGDITATGARQLAVRCGCTVYAATIVLEAAFPGKSAPFALQELFTEQNAKRCHALLSLPDLNGDGVNELAMAGASLLDLPHIFAGAFFDTSENAGASITQFYKASKSDIQVVAGGPIVAGADGSGARVLVPMRTLAADVTGDTVPDMVAAVNGSLTVICQLAPKKVKPVPKGDAPPAETIAAANELRTKAAPAVHVAADGTLGRQAQALLFVPPAGNRTRTPRMAVFGPSTLIIQTGQTQREEHLRPVEVPVEELRVILYNGAVLHSSNPVLLLQVVPLNAHGGTTSDNVLATVRVISNGRELQGACSTEGRIAGCQLNVVVPNTWFLDATSTTAQIIVEIPGPSGALGTPLRQARFVTLVQEDALLETAFDISATPNAVAVLMPGQALAPGAAAELSLAAPSRGNLRRLEVQLTPGTHVYLDGVTPSAGWIVALSNSGVLIATRVARQDSSSLVTGSDGQLELIASVRVRAVPLLPIDVESTEVSVRVLDVASLAGDNLTAAYTNAVLYFRDGRRLALSPSGPVALRPHVAIAVMARPSQYAILNYGAIDVSLASLSAAQLEVGILYANGTQAAGDAETSCSSSSGLLSTNLDCTTLRASTSARSGGSGIRVTIEVLSASVTLTHQVTLAVYHPSNLRIIPGRSALLAPSSGRRDLTRLYLLADFSDGISLYANADIATLLANRLQVTGPVANVAKIVSLDGLPGLVALMPGAVLLQLRGASNSASGVRLPGTVVVGVSTDPIGEPVAPIGLAINLVTFTATLAPESSFEQGVAVYNVQALLGPTIDPSLAAMVSVVLHDAARLELHSDDFFATRIWSEGSPSPVQLASGELELRRLSFIVSGDPNFVLVPVVAATVAGELRVLARLETGASEVLVFGAFGARASLATHLDAALLLAHAQADDYAAATGLVSTGELQFDDGIDLADVQVELAPGSSGRIRLLRQPTSGRWSYNASPGFSPDAVSATGAVQLSITYRGLSVQLDAGVTAVLASSVQARLEGSPLQAPWQSAIQVRSYANAGAGNALTFQRYALRVEMVLAHGVSSLIAAAGAVTYTLPSAGASHLVLSDEPEPRITASRNGAATGVLAFVGNMEPARIPLAVSVSLSDAVAVETLDLAFPTTVAAAYALDATVTTSDGATIYDAFASGWNTRTRAITLAVSGSGQRALRTDASRGVVEATANLAEMVLLLVASGDVTASALIAVNVPLTRVADVDIGPEEGPGAVVLTAGVATLPVYINSGGADVSAVQVLLTLGSSRASLIEILAVSPGADWAGGELAYGITGTSVDFGGLCSMAGGRRLHIANIRVRGSADGNDEITGRVDVLLDGQGRPLHRTSDAAAIMAGRMPLLVSGTGTVGRRRRDSDATVASDRARRASCDALPDLDNDCRVTLLDVIAQSLGPAAEAQDVNQDGVVDDFDTDYLFGTAFNMLPIVVSASVEPVTSVGGQNAEDCAASWLVQLVDSRGNPLSRNAADVIVLLHATPPPQISALLPGTFSPELTPTQAAIKSLAIPGAEGGLDGVWQARATLAQPVFNAGFTFVVAMRDDSTRPQPVATTHVFVTRALNSLNPLPRLNATAIGSTLAGGEVVLDSRGLYLPFLAWSSSTSTPQCLAQGRDEAPAQDNDEAVPVYGWALVGVCVALLALLIGLLAVRKQRRNVYEVCVLPKQLFVDGETDHPWAGRGHTLGYAIRKVGTKKYIRGMDLVLERGTTYRFRVKDVGSDYPFYFSYSEVGGGNGVAEYLHGIQGTPAIDGDTVTFTPPSDCPSQLYYQCTKQKCMGYRIRIVDANRPGLGSNGSSSAFLTTDSFGVPISGTGSGSLDALERREDLLAPGRSLENTPDAPSMLSFRNDNSLKEVLAGEQPMTAERESNATLPPNYRPPPSFGASAARSGGVLGLGQPPLNTFVVPPLAMTGDGDRERRAPQYVPPPVYPLAVQYGAAQRPSGQVPSDAVYLPPPPYVRAFNLLREAANRDLAAAEQASANVPSSMGAFLADPNDGMAPALHLPGLRSGHEPYETYDEDVHVALASPVANVRPGQAIIRRLEHRRQVIEFSEDDGPTTFSSFA